MASWTKSLSQGSGWAASVALRHPRRASLTLFVMVVVMALIFCRVSPQNSTPTAFTQQVYVWQRNWSPAVKSAVRQRGPAFGEVVVLAAEVTWKNGEGKAAFVKLDTDSLRQIHRPIGIALRVNPFDGPKRIDPFNPGGSQSRFICDLAADALDRARRESISPVELQVDFDCPESKLNGYRNWVRAIKQRIAPTPLCITTLPSLVNAADFPDLVRQADSYILQVHSMKRPASPNQIEPLCDPGQARKWVQIASEIGVSFRVALPTYAYVAQFDAKGKCVRLTAEGSTAQIPAGGSSREIRADADTISQLVGEWSNQRPRAMSGLIWYRLPNDDDAYNWRWPTLATVMRGRAPLADPQVSIAPMLEQH